MAANRVRITDNWLVSRGRGAVDPFGEYVVKRLSPGSQRTARQALSVMAGVVLGIDRRDKERLRELDLHAFRWERLTAADIERIREAVVKEYRPATANKMLSLLRGVLRATAESGGAVRKGLAAGIQWVPLPATTDNRVLKPDEVGRLFKACRDESGPAGRRDAALLAACLSSGIRRVEATELRLDDYNRERNELTIGSGGPAEGRLVELSNSACQYIDEWLVERDMAPGPLFLPVTRGGRIDNRQMTDQAIYSILARLSERANVEHVTTRDLRRTYVVGLIASGMSVEKTQAIAGHAHWLTTAMYQDLALSMRQTWPRGVQIPYIADKRALKGGSK